MNIYLDIDGVILANDKQLANHAEQFLRSILNNYPDSTYWLTTHCRGNASDAVLFLSRFLKDDMVELLKKIKPTNWEEWKTEAIDFTQPFLWFDDDLFEVEKNELIKFDALKSWVEIDLSKDKNQLLQIIKKLQL